MSLAGSIDWLKWDEREKTNAWIHWKQIRNHHVTFIRGIGLFHSFHWIIIDSNCFFFHLLSGRSLTIRSCFSVHLGRYWLFFLHSLFLSHSFRLSLTLSLALRSFPLFTRQFFLFFHEYVSFIHFFLIFPLKWLCSVMNKTK